MRHRYDTRGIVLARHPQGEASALVTLITPDLGLVRARAQSLRTSGAKLAPALTTLTESDIILVRGKEGWRLAGAVPEEQWFARLSAASPRERAARVSGLLLRLVAGEAPDADLFAIVRGYLEALSSLPQEVHEGAEILAVLRLLAALGLDAGDIPGESAIFTPDLVGSVTENRAAYVERINRGIAASGL